MHSAEHIVYQATTVGANIRAEQKNQQPFIVWFTGLSGAGKTTLANALECRLVEAGYHSMLLDGDNVRSGLSADLGFDHSARVENLRRVAHVAKLMVEAGLVVIAAFISPFEKERAMVRACTEGAVFIEVFVDTPLSVCEARDIKGLYAKARNGEIKQFTGVDSPYEAPLNAEIHLNMQTLTISKSIDMIMKQLVDRELICKKL